MAPPAPKPKHSPKLATASPAKMACQPNESLSFDDLVETFNTHFQERISDKSPIKDGKMNVTASSMPTIVGAGMLASEVGAVPGAVVLLGQASSSGLGAAAETIADASCLTNDGAFYGDLAEAATGIGALKQVDNAFDALNSVTSLGEVGIEGGKKALDAASDLYNEVLTEGGKAIQDFEDGLQDYITAVPAL